jgi:hypothetical protein
MHGGEPDLPGVSGAQADRSPASPLAESRPRSRVRDRAVAVGIAAAAAVTAILATSGGGSTPTAQPSSQAAALVASARRAIASASSVVVAGSIDSGGQVIGLSLDVVNGRGAEGTMTIRGATIEIIVLHDQGYMTTTVAGWKLLAGADGAEAAAVLNGRWVSLPMTAQFSSLFKLANQNELFGRLLASRGTFVRGSATTLNGQHVMSVTNTATGGTLYIATAGQSYPVEVTKSGPDGGTIRFSNENKPVHLAAPPHPISLTGLGG